MAAASGRADPTGGLPALHPEVRPFRHAATATWSYVVSDPRTRAAAIIDPVLDFELHSGRCGSAAADEIEAFVRDRGLAVEWLLETHAHADHLTAARRLQLRLGGHLAIGKGICDVQRTFATLFDLEPDFATDGRQFDRLLEDGEDLALGSFIVQTIATPGHTSDSLSYRIGDAVFVGDSIFLPDSGTARCDFPGGDAGALWASIQRLYGLPPETRVFVCHDYAPGGREPCCETTIAAERAGNIHVRDGTTAAEFMAVRRSRDAGLDSPRLLYPAVQFNIRAGRPPPPAASGRSWLRLPFHGIGESGS